MPPATTIDADWTRRAIKTAFAFWFVTSDSEGYVDVQRQRQFDVDQASSHWNRQVQVTTNKVGSS